MTVEKLFDARLRDFGRVSETLSPEFERMQTFRRLSEVSDLTSRSIRGALKLGETGLANYIPGIPIPILLSSKNRLTVDIAPPFLVHFEDSYGLTRKALIEFARRKMIVLNIRDYDPRGNRQEQAARYEPFRDFLEELFAVAGESIYFLSSLRHEIFDNLPSSKADRPRLQAVFDATEHLRPAAEAVRGLGVQSVELMEASFRGEPPSLAAVRWHWAYTQCMTGLIADSEILATRQDYYDAVASARSDADKAKAFLTLAKYLRYLHLVHTAPLSASFGGTYNALYDVELRHMQAVRLGRLLHQYDWMHDDLRDLIADLQIGRVPAHLMQQIPARHRALLHYFGVEAYLRHGSEPHFEHYRDPANIDALEQYLSEDDGTERTLREVHGYLDELMDQPQAEIARGIVDLAAMSEEARTRRAIRLARLTAGHQTIEVPSLDHYVRALSTVVATDPLKVNIRIRLHNHRDGHGAPNVPASMGHKGDFRRKIIGIFRMFKGPPT